MRFISKISIPAGGTTPSPIPDASLIDLEAVFVVEASLLNTDTAGRKSLLALEGVALQTATIQFWVLDDEGFNRVNDFDVANAKWSKLEAPIVLTVGEAVDGPPLSGGRIYVEVTVGAVAASVIKIGMSP